MEVVESESMAINLTHSKAPELREELKNSSLKIWKTRAEKAHLEQQVQEERRRGEELSQQHDAETHKRQGALSRLSEELKEKEERWLSCQLRCESLCEEQLAWQQREKQQVALRTVAEEEVMSLKKAQENLQQEAEELKRERSKKRERERERERERAAAAQHSCHDILLERERERERASTQNALCLKKQKEELCREAELEMMIDREKSQLLLQQYQRDITQFQSKRRTREEAETRRGAEETRRREEETRRMKEEMKRMEEETSRREEEMRRELERLRREEALEISGAKAELQLLTNENAQLQQEVALLQETVRRECQERGELTAALTRAREQLLQGHCSVPRLLPSRPQHTQERPGSLDKEQGQPRDPSAGSLARHSKPRSPLRPSPPPPCADKEEGRGGARSAASWDGGGEVGQSGGKGEVRAKGRGSSVGSLPRLSATGTTREVKRKVGLTMGRTDRA
ncbi:unnamed protein product [Merluccius merluccius]